MPQKQRDRPSRSCVGRRQPVSHIFFPGMHRARSSPLAERYFAECRQGPCPCILKVGAGGFETVRHAILVLAWLAAGVDRKTIPTDRH